MKYFLKILSYLKNVLPFFKQDKKRVVSPYGVKLIVEDTFNNYIALETINGDIEVKGVNQNKFKILVDGKVVLYFKPLNVSKTMRGHLARGFYTHHLMVKTFEVIKDA